MSLTGERAGGGDAAVRIDAIDALRGFAVLGIFVINIVAFAMPEAASYNPREAGDDIVDYALWTAAAILVEGSMRGLFSLMFGASVILFMVKETKGAGAAADLYYRRTIWLIVFGVIHGYLLLWPGDILLIYGLAGLFLFPFRGVEPRRLALIAAAVLVGFSLFQAAQELDETALGSRAEAAAAKEASGAALTAEESSDLDEWKDVVASIYPSDEDVQQAIAARTGAPSAIYAANAEWANSWNTTAGLLWWSAEAFMMMLLGMALLRWRVLTAERSMQFYLMLGALGYAAGLGLRLWIVWTRWSAEFDPMLWAWPVVDQYARVALTLGHIGAFMLAWKAFRSSVLMRALKAAGRMALSNYIAQTVAANLMFSGIGFGLYGSLDLAAVYTVMAGIWAVQLAFSLWWLGRFRFGPLEWVWRSLTYWRLQPLLKQPKQVLAAPV